MKYRALMMLLILMFSVWILSWQPALVSDKAADHDKAGQAEVRLGNLDGFTGKAGEFNQAYLEPGVYLDEVTPLDNLSIVGVDTTTAGFLGQTEKGPLEPTLVTSYQEFENLYGGNPQGTLLLPYAVKGFFDNGGNRLYIARVTLGAKNLNSKAIRSMRRPDPQPVLSDYIGRTGPDASSSTGLNALGLIDDISMLYAPDAQSMPDLAEAMVAQCEALKDRIVILEAAKGDPDPDPLEDFDSKYAAYYAPWVQVNDAKGQSRLVPPGGFIAGTFSKTDRTRGVHKAPANVPLVGVTGLERTLTYTEQDDFSIKHVNPVISRYGSEIVAYGGRSLTEDPEYRYICLTRYTAYVKESLAESLMPLVFEEWNSRNLSKAKLACHEFLTQEWHKGALMGNKATEAFFLEVNPYGESSLGIRTCLALVRPAEFYIVGISLDRE